MREIQILRYLSPTTRTSNNHKRLLRPPPLAGWPAGHGSAPLLSPSIPRRRVTAGTHLVHLEGFVAPLTIEFCPLSRLGNCSANHPFLSQCDNILCDTRTLPPGGIVMRTSAELSIYSRSRGEIRRRLVGPQMCLIHHYRLSLHSLLPNCPSGGHPRSLYPGRQISPLQPPSLASHLF